MTSWFAMRFENARRDKMALTDPAYATGAENLDTMSGLRYDYYYFTYIFNQTNLCAIQR